MAKMENLSTPPIQEAVIDFIIECIPLSEEQIRDFAKGLFNASGWVSEDIRRIETTVDFSPTAAVPAYSNNFEGVRATSPDQTHILQIRPSRISASIVKSYEKWDVLQDLSLQCLGEFQSSVGKVVVSRVAARFINIIQINNGLAGTLARCPSAGVDGAEVVDFLDRHVIKFDRLDATVNLTIATVVHEFSAGVPQKGVLVDVDAFHEGQFQLQDDSLVQALSVVRNAKNEIFFGSITDEALEIYR